MGSKADDKDTFDPLRNIDENTLLQLDGSMVLGALIILTLAGIISPIESYARTISLYFTVIVVVPFIVSALLILISKRERLKGFRRARGWTTAGFIFFLLIIMYLALDASIGEPIGPSGIPGDVRLQCIMNPETFNVSTSPWKCDHFDEDSVAWFCANNPEFYNLTISDCADLIPPSG